MTLKLGEIVQCWTEEINFLGFGEIVGIGKTVIFVLIKDKLYYGDDYYLIPKLQAYRATARILKDLK